MAYLKRVFLNPISEGAPSFIQAVADSSDEGTYLLGNYLLIIADCDRRIMLKFHVGSPKYRKRARAKIDRMAQVVNDFRDALLREIELIDKADAVRESRQMPEDVLTKGWLIKWLGHLPDDTNIALEIKEYGQLDFIVTAPNGQDRILR